MLGSCTAGSRGGCSGRRGPTLLTVEAERLQSSRARGVDAAEAERRRIERDLHDGAQQRLVAVAMGLGRAKSKMDTDPDGGGELIDEAHADAKLAVSELRDLARGIYPSVLGDRGLDAALSSLAARCADPGGPAGARGAAAADVGGERRVLHRRRGADERREALERRPRRTVQGEPDATPAVLVEVTDDGQGGAELRPGGGLAGLADRAATIDGVMIVVSPIGGPTVIRAELPCAW